MFSQELRYKTEQIVTVGVLLKRKRYGYPNVPFADVDIRKFRWGYVEKADGSFSNILSRSWEPIPHCAGVYHLSLSQADTNQRGALTFYLHDDRILGKPIFMQFAVISKNMFDMKYKNTALKVQSGPQSA